MSVLLKNQIKDALLKGFPKFNSIPLRKLQTRGSLFQKKTYLELEIERVYSLLLHQNSIKPTSS